jgi:hypothetical protein
VEQRALALLLWGLALLLWLALTYTIFTGLTIKQNKPPLDKGINGAWLLAVVATQSIATLSALLAPRLGQPVRLELTCSAMRGLAASAPRGASGSPSTAW